MTAIYSRFAFALTICMGLALGGCSEEGNPAQTNAARAETLPVTPDIPLGSGFDFYVLALSWSPTYCLSEGKAKSDRNQCGRDADFGFIVHGLWPQFEDDHPAYCRSRQPERVPAALGERLFDIAPSMGLIGHMWRKHGTCSGLSQRDYFEVVRAAWERVRIPREFTPQESGKTPKAWQMSAEAVEKSFISANSGLESDAIAAVCANGRLREVRICLTDDLRFRTCKAVDRAGCKARSLSVPPVR